MFNGGIEINKFNIYNFSKNESTLYCERHIIIN